jgi:hypothetical protein
VPDFLFWLLPFAFFLAIVTALTWLGRAPSPRRSSDPRGLDTETSRFFFLPSTPEAWAEVCRSCEGPGGTDAGAWSHPLIGEALEDAEPSIRDGRSVLTYVEFTRVYESRRRLRLEHCTTIYLERV